MYLPFLLAASLLHRHEPSRVTLNHADSGWQLLVDGKPFLIKGGGGDGDKKELVELGGNSYRTWGADNLDDKLAEARRLGLKVTIGIWLGHKEHGFKYDDPKMVNDQLSKIKDVVLKYKDNPALLMWGLGNEMEVGFPDDDPDVWNAVEDIAHEVKKLDPNHPTMTVIAEIGDKKAASIQQYCPSVDIVGINSYGGAPSVAKRYREQGCKKPFVLTEYGPAGVWEIGTKTSWGAPEELTSTQKEESYRKAYEATVVDAKDICLGSYAFTWGHKVEATETWFGLLLAEDESKLGPVDTISKLWTGKEVDHRCPRIDSIALTTEGNVDPSDKVQVALTASDPGGDKIEAHWKLMHEGEGDQAPVPDVIKTSDLTGATLQMPADPGKYRLYVVVKNQHGGAATANVPLRVRGGARAAGAPKRSLPLSIYSDSGASMPFAPSGWMGDTGAMKLDLASTDSPHAGSTCIRWDLNESSGWGGVAWQNPAGDWGDKEGGFNLTGATKLTFWARGAQGGEVASFGIGNIKANKPFHDSVIKSLGDITLGTDWQQYSLDLDGQNLERVKTGFLMVMAAKGNPQTVYLDEIRIE
jgi:glycosyl hydrolase family 2